MKKFILFSILLIFSIPLFSQNLSWKHLNLDVGKIITKILQDSTGRLIIKSEKGLLIFTDSSHIHRIDTLLQDSVDITCMALDSKNNLYIGTMKNGIFLFDDINNKWVAINNNLENLNTRTMFINSNDDILLGTTNTTIYKKASNALNWSQLCHLLDGEIYFQCININKNGDIRIAYYNDIYVCLANSHELNYTNNITINSEKIYLSTVNKSIISNVGTGYTWTQLYEGLGTDINVLDVLTTKKVKSLQ